MKRIKFEVIVTDNGVTITDRDRLFYNISATECGMIENLQCDYDNSSFVYEMLSHSCNVIATEFEDLVSILEGNNEKPQPVVSKYAEVLFDPASDYESYRELLRRGHKETIEIAAEMFSNIEESKKNIKISHLNEKS